MHLRSGKYLFSFTLLLLSLTTQAAKRTRILFLLDASSSMTLTWKDSSSRFDVATQLLLGIIDSVNEVNPDVEFAVRTYGTSHPAQEKNCTDTKLEVPFNFGNITQIKTRLKYILPVGYSPIAYSLEQASKNELSEPKKYDYSIIFITDGGESCNGDICISYSKFIAGKISVKPYVIGLDKNVNLSNYYQCMGNYLDVVTEDDVPKAVKMIVDANRRIISKMKTDEPVGIEPVVERNTLASSFLLPHFFHRSVDITAPNVRFFNPTQKKVTLKWNFEEEKKPEPSRKTLDYITSFYAGKKRSAVSKIQPRSFKVKKKAATLRFEIEEEVVRDPSGLSSIFPPELSFKKHSIGKIKANTASLKKKISVHINYEEEIVRSGYALSSIFLPEPALKKSNSVKVKPGLAPLKKKLTLHLLIEDPIERMDASYLFITNLKTKPTPKAATLVAKSATIKKTSARLFFEVPIERINAEYLFITNLKTKPTPKVGSNVAKAIAIKKKSARLFFDDPIERKDAAYLVISNLKTMPSPKVGSLVAKSVAVKNKSTRINFTFPIERDSFRYVRLIPQELKPKAQTSRTMVTAKSFNSRAKKATLYFTVEVPKKDTIIALKAKAFPKKMGYALSLPYPLPVRSNAKPVLHFTFDIPKVKKVAKGDMDFTIKTEASAETTIQIFLKGEDGTMYPNANPKIEMVDTVTKDTIRFVRNVASGSPQKEKIKAGVYDIFIREYNVARSYGVEIVPKSNNEVTLELRRGTLYFAYSNDIKKKVNYHAVVKKRFAEKLVVRQSCAEVLKYDPGTYLVEITDMLPPMQAIVYLDFFVDYLISIPEPGTVQFTNTAPLGKVILQATLGDGYANFYELNINGKPEDQTLTLRHGVYRAIIPVDPKMPMAGTKVVEFKVVSTKNTQVELK